MGFSKEVGGEQRGGWSLKGEVGGEQERRQGFTREVGRPLRGFFWHEGYDLSEKYNLLAHVTTT